MSSTVDLPLSSLMLDLENPRLDIQASQREAIRAMAAVQAEKLFELAKDIIKNGVNPSELSIVMPLDRDSKMYVVLEGNRRIATLKILSTPDLISGAVKTSLEKKLRDISKTFQVRPIDTLSCVVVANREAAEHWIMLKHTGENQGAGTVSWGTTESERFAERNREKKLPRRQVFDFVRTAGTLSPEAQSLVDAGKIAITNIERLVEDSYVCAKLGIETRDGEVMTRYSHQEVLKGLTKIVEDIARKKIKVGDIHSSKHRKAYIDAFLPEQLPDPGTRGSALLSLASAPDKTEGRKKQPAGPKTKVRPSTQARQALIPKDCRLNINQTRVNNIYDELRQLVVAQHPNAVAVLFRVFLELSVDTYLQEKGLMSGHQLRNSHLHGKLLAVANDFEAKNIMSKQQLQPVKRTASDRYLLVSTETLHGYVHNQHLSPLANDLKTTWDDLQPFIVNIWSS